MTITVEQMDALKAAKEEAKAHCKTYYDEVTTLRARLQIANENYEIWNKRFESADHELALHDGRLTILPGPGQRKSRIQEDVEIKLTKEQILRIAESLGVDLDEEDFEEQEQSFSEDDGL